MNCSACGTRTAAKERNCPNCGRNLSGQARSRTEAQDAAAGSSRRALSPSSAKAPGPRDGLRDASGRKSGRSSRKKSREQSPEVSLEEPVDKAAVGSGSDCKVATAQIRALVQDRPDCLEEGLSIYTNAAAEAVGLDFPTDVGAIDLLARDDAGGLVVVLIAPEASQAAAGAGKDSVSQALERVGWVRKHVAEPQQEVRAIVLLEQVPDDFSYTAAAVASTVSFKTYRLEISFSEVEV